MNKDGFKPNLETHLNPLLATKHDDASVDIKDKNNKDSHHPLLMQVIFKKSCFFFLSSLNGCIVSCVNHDILFVFLNFRFYQMNWDVKLMT